MAESNSATYQNSEINFEVLVDIPNRQPIPEAVMFILKSLINPIFPFAGLVLALVSVLPKAGSLAKAAGFVPTEVWAFWLMVAIVFFIARFARR